MNLLIIQPKSSKFQNLVSSKNDHVKCAEQEIPRAWNNSCALLKELVGCQYDLLSLSISEGRHNTDHFSSPLQLFSKSHVIFAQISSMEFQPTISQPLPVVLGQRSWKLLVHMHEETSVEGRGGEEERVIYKSYAVCQVWWSESFLSLSKWESFSLCMHVLRTSQHVC